MFPPATWDQNVFHKPSPKSNVMEGKEGTIYICYHMFLSSNNYKSICLFSTIQMYQTSCGMSS